LLIFAILPKIPSYPVKKFIVLQRYRAVSYKVKKRTALRFFLWWRWGAVCCENTIISNLVLLSRAIGSATLRPKNAPPEHFLNGLSTLRLYIPTTRKVRFARISLLISGVWVLLPKTSFGQHLSSLLRSSKLSGEYKLFFCFIGVYAIAIISYPVKSLLFCSVTEQFPIK